MSGILRQLGQLSHTGWRQQVAVSRRLQRVAKTQLQSWQKCACVHQNRSLHLATISSRATARTPLLGVSGPGRPASPMSIYSCGPGRPVASIRWTGLKTSTSEGQAQVVATEASKSVPLDNNDNLTVERGPIEQRWRPLVHWNARDIFGLYMDLTKMRLSALVVLTTMVSYGMAPGTVSLATLLYTSIGTGLCVSSANSINQWFEVPFDAQMSRTRNRVLVRQALSPLHALSFGLMCGAAGTGLLCIHVNSLVAMLGLANILLYTCVYTPTKRSTIANTWYGAIVGAIPPMMGWAACTGGLDDGAWVLAGLLYAWQFPHFNALSWNLRQDYSMAGYKMMSVTDPGLCRRVSLRYSLAMLPLCLLCPYLEMTTPAFALTSTIANGYLIWESVKFYRRPNAKSARGLFFASIIHLPILLSLLLLHKKHKKPIQLDQAGEERKEFIIDATVVEPVGTGEAGLHSTHSTLPASQ